MVDFEAYTAEKGDIFRYIDNNSDRDRDRDSDSDEDRSAPPKNRQGKKIRRLRLEKPSVGKGWCCECENCIGRDTISHSVTFYNYDSVDPKGEPPNREHYFFICSRDVPAFSLRDREFGKTFFH